MDTYGGPNRIPKKNPDISFRVEGLGLRVSY